MIQLIQILSYLFFASHVFCCAWFWVGIQVPNPYTLTPHPSFLTPHPSPLTPPRSPQARKEADAYKSEAETTEAKLAKLQTHLDEKSAEADAHKKLVLQLREGKSQLDDAQVWALGCEHEDTRPTP